MKKKPLNIQERAKKAGVSVATISRAMNPETRAKLAPETLERVDALVRRHGYTPNLAARHLRKSSYRTLGLVFPHHPGILSSEYYSEILSGVADGLYESEYRLKMILLKPGAELWDRYDFRGGESIDGMILTYWRSVFSDADVFKTLKIPCVVVNNVEKNLPVHFVAADHFEGGRLAAHHLAENGHREIAVFSGPLYSPDTVVRLAGFRAGLQEAGLSLPDSRMIDVNFEEEKAYGAAAPFLKKHPEVTALFCMNDVQAHGVLRRLKELNVPCPGKISVIGYDDDRPSANSEPPLTTVRAPVYELGRLAAQDLIAHLAAPEKPAFGEARMLPVTLIERASVKLLN